MSNSEFCCAVGLCCPPASAQRRSSLIHELAHDLKDPDNPVVAATVADIADWLIANVDMVPKGTIDLSHVADIVKKHGGA